MLPAFGVIRAPTSGALPLINAVPVAGVIDGLDSPGNSPINSLPARGVISRCSSMPKNASPTDGVID